MESIEWNNSFIVCYNGNTDEWRKAKMKAKLKRKNKFMCIDRERQIESQIGMIKQRRGNLIKVKDSNRLSVLKIRHPK